MGVGSVVRASRFVYTEMTKAITATNAKKFYLHASRIEAGCSWSCGRMRLRRPNAWCSACKCSRIAGFLFYFSRCQQRFPLFVFRRHKIFHGNEGWFKKQCGLYVQNGITKMILTPAKYNSKLTNYSEFKNINLEANLFLDSLRSW